MTVEPDSLWLPEYQRLPSVTRREDGYLTLHNIRNFRYGPDGNLRPDWYDRTFRLSDVRQVDLILSYWASPHIAHVFLSFGLADGTWIAISVETRRKLSQPWSVLRGFLFQYPVIYIAADERDVIGVRALLRQEQVYAYPLTLDPSDAASLLNNYVERIARLHLHQERYHTLWNNCTTNILRHGRTLSPAIRYHWRVLLSGHADRYCYDHQLLDNRLAFDKLKEQCRVKLADPGSLRDSFSADIRQHRLTTHDNQE